MRFSIEKNITLKKESPLKEVVTFLIYIVGIPVIIIAGVSISIYLFFLWLKNKISRQDDITFTDEHYHLEFDLVNNNYIRLILIEDELDNELTELNETWDDEVYTNDESYLYRVRSIPSIPLLDGGICCFYYKEMHDGLILQVFIDDEKIALNPILIFLDYKNFEVTQIDKTGPFILKNDDKNAMSILGFSKKEKLRIELSRLDDSAS